MLSTPRTINGGDECNATARNLQNELTVNGMAMMEGENEKEAAM